MKLRIQTKSLYKITKVARLLLSACALVLLGYVAFSLTDAWLYQSQKQNELETLLSTLGIPATMPKDRAGSLVGRLEVERLGLSVVVMEGTSHSTLKRAVGHITGTPLPGQPGNTALSGHRDTFFRPLRNINPSDIISVTTLGGVFHYQVISTRIVAPTELTVLAPTTQESLTLITCHPFYYVGPAPNRFVVLARRI